MLHTAVVVKNVHARDYFRCHRSRLSDVSIVLGLFAREAGMSSKTKTIYIELARR
jgi:hypothetical protein